MVGVAILGLAGCDTNPVRDVHPMTNFPFASSYPIGEDGSSHAKAAKSQTYCSYCGKKIPRPAHKGPMVRGADGEPL